MPMTNDQLPMTNYNQSKIHMTPGNISLQHICTAKKANRRHISKRSLLEQTQSNRLIDRESSTDTQVKSNQSTN